jgi:hypothetical protein
LIRTSLSASEGAGEFLLAILWIPLRRFANNGDRAGAQFRRLFLRLRLCDLNAARIFGSRELCRGDKPLFPKRARSARSPSRT